MLSVEELTQIREALDPIRARLGNVAIFDPDPPLDPTKLSQMDVRPLVATVERLLDALEAALTENAELRSENEKLRKIAPRHALLIMRLEEAIESGEIEPAEPLTIEQRERFIAAAERGLAVHPETETP